MNLWTGVHAVIGIIRAAHRADAVRVGISAAIDATTAQLAAEMGEYLAEARDETAATVRARLGIGAR